MAWRVAIGCALLLAACGRIGFTDGDSGDDTVDGGTGDGPTGDAGPLLDCTETAAGAALCAGFEGTGMDGWDYSIIDFGNVTLSTTRAYRGAQSLEVQTDASNNYKYARWGKNYVVNEIAAGDLYVRGYYWIASTTVVNDQLSIMVTGNAAPPYGSTNVLLKPGELHAVVDGTNYITQFDFPRDRWVCLLLHIIVGATGGVEVDVDGARILTRNNIETRVGGGYTNVDVGVHYATPTQTASHLWIDELVLDTAPVSCN